MACYLLTGGQGWTGSCLLGSLIGRTTQSKSKLRAAGYAAATLHHLNDPQCLGAFPAGAYPFLDRVCPDMPDLARTLRRQANIALWRKVAGT